MICVFFRFSLSDLTCRSNAQRVLGVCLHGLLDNGWRTIHKFETKWFVSHDIFMSSDSSVYPLVLMIHMCVNRVLDDFVPKLAM